MTPSPSWQAPRSSDWMPPPDGTAIVARYGYDDTAKWFLDPSGGPGERVLTGVSDAVSWQRLAP
jgi:hypothetical protein